MSGTYPSSPGFAAVGFKARAYNVKSENPAGIDHVRGLGGHRWEWSVQYHDLPRDEFAPVAAFVVKQSGGRETFQITLPSISDQRGSASGTARVNNGAGYAIGVTDITIDGLTGSLLTEGMVKFENHSKVYMIMADRSGSGTLEIYPPLVAAVVDNEIITYDGVEFTARMENDVQEWAVDIASDRSFELDMIEAL